MLTRASRGESHHFIFKTALATYERLQLPWLCPAVLLRREPQKRRASLHVQTQPRRKAVERREASRTRIMLHTQSPRRTPEVLQFATGQEYIPFDNVTTPHVKGSNSDKPPSYLFKPFDPSNLLTISVDAPLSATIQKQNSQSILGGDVADIQQNLYACVHVGRHDRAEALIRRLQDIYHPTSAELLDAHNQYLTGLLESLVRDPSNAGLIAMQKWFEVDVRGTGVLPNSSTIAIMMKASMSVLNGLKLERTIRRYLHLAKLLGSDVEEGTLCSPLFLDSEWSRMIRLLPEQHEAPSEEIFDSDNTPSPRSSADSDVNQSPHIPENEANESKDLRTLVAVDQKGLGLESLKSSLSSFQELLNPVPSVSKDEKMTQETLRQHQLRLERDAVASAVARWHNEAEQMTKFNFNGSVVTPKLGTFLWEWLEEIVTLVKADIAFSKIAANEKGMGPDDLDLIFLGPYLKLVDPVKLVAIALLRFIACIGERRHSQGPEQRSYSITLGPLVHNIGRAIQGEIIADLSEEAQKLKKLKSLTSQKRRKALNRIIYKGNTYGKSILPIAKTDIAEPSSPLTHENKWTGVLITKLGAYMVSKIIKVARLPIKRQDPSTGKEIVQSQRVTSHGLQYSRGKRYGTVMVHPELVSKLRREPVGYVLAKHLPMLVEPKKWTKLKDGGYLTHKIKAVRFRDTSLSQETYVKAAIENGDMDQVFDGLNVISKVPWRINREVFMVMSEAWNSGEAIGGLAPQDPIIPYPPEPTGVSDRKLRRKWQKLINQIENEKSGYHSQRCFQNFQLEVARSFLDHKFYCPHNVDFRGRAYPIPPYFNHMGADHCRGLLIFAEGKELGSLGLTWLKIHLANVYGYDKASLKDREDFTMAHLADIYDSANDPIKGKRWWLTAEDPWQCLAACIELKNALEAPVPAQYVSHVPIHQDGTCNGLQHYAALGGDVIGARQVNLEPGDRPADIYTAVAEMVKDAIEADAAKGEKEAQTLSGKVTRKVVKQTVMTNVYGVTFHGARNQVKNQLMDIFPKPSIENPIDIGRLSVIIARKIFKALSSMFGGAHAIQDWLGDCAGRISTAVTSEQIERMVAKRQGESESVCPKFRNGKGIRISKDGKEAQFKSTVVWTTPLGMPVVQPYRAPKMSQIRTSLQLITMMLPSMSDPVSKRKQLQAFPPNFIHSLDATHMLLSAIKCNEIGLTFAAVHDSFWTHASDVPVMNRVLRDAFVRMHSEPIIERLRAEFIARYKGCMYVASVSARTDVGKKILAWRLGKSKNPATTHAWRKSKGFVDELLLEHKRMQLLRSDDPRQQNEGREMVTPTSIFESTPSSNESLHPEMRESLRLGDVPDSIIVDKSHDTPLSVDEIDEDDHFNIEQHNLDKLTKSHSMNAQKVSLWLPLTFPPAPKKGEFDVSRLKDSQYFFS